MSLVTYDYSDDEEDSSFSNDDTPIKPLNNTKEANCSANSNSKENISTKANNQNVETNLSLSKVFARLPSVQNVSFDLSKNVIKKSSSGRIQITAPSLSLVNQHDSSEDSDEEERRRKRIKKSEKGSHLMSLLPKPKNFKSQNSSTSDSSSNKSKSTLTSLVPKSVSDRSKSNIAKPKTLTSNKKESVISEKDKNNAVPQSSNFFFSSYDDEDDEDDYSSVKIPFEDQLKDDLISQASTSKSNIEDNDYCAGPVYGPVAPVENTYNDSNEAYQQGQSGSVIDPNKDITYKKYIASKFGEENAQDIRIVDVDVSKHLSQNQDWLKNITMEKGVRDEDIDSEAPNSTARRKNQITFLAHQAKKREVELKNQWAQNRLTKSQTKAKYGF